jgi:hypothetical protein
VVTTKGVSRLVAAHAPLRRRTAHWRWDALHADGSPSFGCGMNMASTSGPAVVLGGNEYRRSAVYIVSASVAVSTRAARDGRSGVEP